MTVIQYVMVIPAVHVIILATNMWGVPVTRHAIFSRHVKVATCPVTKKPMAAPVTAFVINIPAYVMKCAT